MKTLKFSQICDFGRETERVRLYHKKASGIIINSRATWMEKGEKCTDYFFKLVHRNQTRKNVTWLETENGSVLSSILEEEKSLFQNIYTVVEENCLPPDLYQSFLPASHPKKLSENCEGMIYEDELRQAIDS